MFHGHRQRSSKKKIKKFGIKLPFFYNKFPDSIVVLNKFGGLFRQTPPFPAAGFLDKACYLFIGTSLIMLNNKLPQPFDRTDNIFSRKQILTENLFYFPRIPAFKKSAFKRTVFINTASFFSFIVKKNKSSCFSVPLFLLYRKVQM